jgi:hypothetical protein
MIEFTDGERSALTQTRALASDDQGREVLVGLTCEETALCVVHIRSFLGPNRDKDLANRAKYLELNKKHERARRVVVGMESSIRTGNLPGR